MIHPANLFRTRATSILANTKAMQAIQGLASDTAAKGEYAFIFEGELTDNEKKALTDLGFDYHQHWKTPTEDDKFEHINKYTISF